jgi:hypothetical protein
MKRILSIFLGFIIFAAFFASFANVSAAEPEPEWDLTMKQTWLDGNADFWLHYPDPDPHVISQLHAPQQQQMTLIELRYTLAKQKDSYLKLSYGTTGNGNKGRGFDADWTDDNDYNKITDYGTMEFYGKQENLSIDYVRKINETGNSKTHAFIGWTQHQSSNELRDVLYYRATENDNTVDYDPPRSQEDIGAYYNMTFYGLRLGLEHSRQIGSNLSLTGMASLDFLDTGLYAEWTNYNPVWVFKDSGNTLGYEFAVDVKYRLGNAVSLKLGYSYYYAKSENCTRLSWNKYSDGYTYGYKTLSQPTDLELAQHGYYIGFAAQF